MNILVIGANSMLGQEIKKKSGSFPKWNFYYCAPAFKMLQSEKLETIICEKKISCIINCPDYIDVDKAEKEAGMAYLLNAYVLKDLSLLANQYNLKFVHISTDFVFKGTSCKPYVETDEPNPINQYGKSKLAGERIIQLLCPNAIIIRASWLYSSQMGDCVQTILALAKMDASILMVYNQISSPTWAGDLAMVILQMFNDPQTGTNKTGIYHYSNEGTASCFDFAKEIIKLSGLNCGVSPIRSSELPQHTKRPAFSVLCKEKIKADYGFSIPDWRESLKKCFEEVVALEESHC